MFPLFQFGRMHAIEIRDVACLAYRGERASWWQLMVRMTRFDHHVPHDVDIV